MPEHALTACTKTPLASYLKGLGIFRLVSEQKDPNARAYWKDDVFVLQSVISEDELIEFIMHQYAPTPIVAPWNGGSGFYSGDKKDAISAIETTTDKRFCNYRETLAAIKAWPEMPSAIATPRALCDALDKIQTIKSKTTHDHLSTIKSKCPKKYLDTAFDIPLTELKDRNQGDEDWKNWYDIITKAETAYNKFIREKFKIKLIGICRSRLPDHTLPWLDAVCSLDARNNASYNPLLGTGGNEGRLEYTNNFMQHIVYFLIKKNSAERAQLIRASLLGTPISGLTKAKYGQFYPGRAGGFNQGQEFETKDIAINPLDYILMFEGAILFASAITRRGNVSHSTFAAPFAVRFSPVGFNSSNNSETGKGEVWLPLWNRPTNLKELKHLFSEGRASLGKRHARNGLEFSRAVGLLGVDRGITSFERYTFLQRRGDSNVALPAGTIPVMHYPQLEILKELDGILNKLDWFIRQFKTPPASLSSARRAIDTALFECHLHPSPEAFIAILRALGRVEQFLSRRGRKKKPQLDRPLYGLSAKWLLAADDNCVEVRIAAALASLKATDGVGPLRANMTAVSPKTPKQWETGSNQRNWVGNNLSERLANVIKRRIMDAERLQAKAPPFQGSLPIHPNDVMSFLMNKCDDKKLEELLWAFSLMGFNPFDLKKVSAKWAKPLEYFPLIRQWCLLKLVHWPGKLRNTLLKAEPRVANLLQASRGNEALEIAVRRLRVSGCRPYEMSFYTNLNPTRLLAALLIPVTNRSKLESLALRPLPHKN